MRKKKISAEQIYKKRQKKAKTLKLLAPIIFWGCIALSIVCLVFAIRNSFGNVGEIISMLDSKKFTGEQLQANYAYLTGKYGEWVIGNGSAGFVIYFVDIGKAVFSGVMLANAIFSVVFFVSAYILGKWLLPMLSTQFTQDNQDMVNLTILRNNKE